MTNPFSNAKGWSRYTGLLLLVAILVAIPLLLSNKFYFDVVIRIAINAIIVIGLNLLLGYAGQLSLGHAAFFGIGAYASAVLSGPFGWPPLLALVTGAAAVGLLAFIVARPILKLKGYMLAMATLGLGIIISIAINNETQWTGGPDGVSVPSLEIFGWTVSGDLNWYILISSLLVLVVWGALNLIDSPGGRALQALHGSEVAARVVGVQTSRFKSRIFVLSAVIASVAGSLTAHYVGFITPGIAGFFHSIELVTMVVVGGMASVFGSVVGAALLTLLPQLLVSFDGWETVVYGVILMSTMLFMPKGLVPTLAKRFGQRG
ncbi:branched-chain amino acid ABC transporter permease [Orrella sp. NBD-18]|uniref:Branched-chain amino acid ABC transporter permease n=1 Tax=Sheuella amnicola TaxID=2707330 RepID=A0A6B2QSH4_9BURK|nr:branched-chain amino acid ABC transporter permease [Sheuella amnicola]NDY81626.1 branched-chain amino acid ABC transporter permease [Sheuella amnicola]HBI83760.1 branched-chain amino acid ABC transporter permease [Alcaligenaceae bacterium]